MFERFPHINDPLVVRWTDEISRHIHELVPSAGEPLSDESPVLCEPTYPQSYQDAQADLAGLESDQALRELLASPDAVELSVCILDVLTHLSVFLITESIYSQRFLGVLRRLEADPSSLNVCRTALRLKLTRS